MKCPACGKENPAGEQYCLDCGSDLNAAAAPAAASAAPRGGGSPAASGGLAFSDEEFQRMLQTPPQPTTCPHCGAAAPVSGQFCDNCGQPLTEQPAAAAPAATDVTPAQAADAAAATAQSAPAAPAAAPADQQPAAASVDKASAPTMSIPAEQAAPAPPAAATIAFDLSGPASSSHYEMQS